MSLMAANTALGLRKDDLLARLRKSTRSLKAKADQPTFEDLSARKIPEEKLREQDLVSTTCCIDTILCNDLDG